MGFVDGRAEMIGAVFSELGTTTAEFVPLTGDVVSPCNARLENEQEFLPDYRGQVAGFRRVIRYDFSQIARDVEDGEYFIVDGVKYHVAEMVEGDSPGLTRRVRVTIK